MKPKQVALWGEVYAVLETTGKLSPKLMQNAVESPLSTFGAASKTCYKSMSPETMKQLTALLQAVDTSEEGNEKLTLEEQSSFWVGFCKRKGQLVQPT